MGKMYDQYSLQQDKTGDERAFLKYSQVITGYTGNADKPLYFGILEYDKGKLLFESEYTEKKYGLKNVILKK